MIVTLDRFGKLCDLFGPVIATPPKRTTNIMQNVHEVLRNDWFHGEMTKEDAESRLTNVVPGTFLVLNQSLSGLSPHRAKCLLTLDQAFLYLRQLLHHLQNVQDR